jgi:hypothetical protein
MIGEWVRRHFSTNTTPMPFGATLATAASGHDGISMREMNGFMLQMKATSYLKAMLDQEGPAQALKHSGPPPQAASSAQW